MLTPAWVFQIHVYSSVHVGIYKVGSKQVFLCCYFFHRRWFGRAVGWVAWDLNGTCAAERQVSTHVTTPFCYRARYLSYTCKHTHAHIPLSQTSVHAHVLTQMNPHLHIHTRVHAMTYSIAVPTQRTPWCKNWYTHFRVFLMSRMYVYADIYIYLYRSLPVSMCISI